jgi:glycopeptide antibiotics resistance protein
MRPVYVVSLRLSAMLARLARMIRSRRLASVLTLGYALLLGFVVFWPSGELATNSVYYIWRALDLLGAPAFVSPSSIEFLTNMLLFVPLSFLGSTYRPSWGWFQWLLAGLAGTLAIEFTQWVLLAGRSASLMDIISNTLGALLGYALVIVLRRFR